MIKEIVFDSLKVGENIRNTFKNAADLNIRGTVDSYVKSVPGVYALGKAVPLVANKAAGLFISTGGGKVASATMTGIGKAAKSASHWWLTPARSAATATSKQIAKVGVKPLAIKTGKIGLAIAADHFLSKLVKTPSIIDFTRGMFNKDIATAQVNKDRNIFQSFVELTMGGPVRRGLLELRYPKDSLRNKSRESKGRNENRKQSKNKEEKKK